MDDTLALVGSFALSTGIGLLVGLERERNPAAKAGVRTFALIAILGTLGGLLGDVMDSAWPAAAAALAVAAALIAANLHDPETVREDSGTTTVVAALVVFFLGTINYHGYPVIAVALGVGMTVLLYFKAELEQFSQKLTPQDIRSMLQFAVLSAVILPLLPDRPFGPYGVLNPFHIWLMVVLIAGVSLAGYVAWRLTLGRHGLLLTGVLGGIVSSTATTLVYARQARAGTQTPASALLVILLANATMLVRVLALIAIIAPSATAPAAMVLGPAALGAALPVAARWRRVDVPADEGDGYRNPTNLLTALTFAAAYALVLLLAAWAAATIGDRGVYALALISGLTDVDAITLSSLRLLESGTLQRSAALTAIALAVGSNLVVKAVLSAVMGGAPLRWPAAVAFALPIAGLLAGVWLLRALA